MKKFITVLICSQAIVCGVLFAQSEKKIWTLEECVQTALENNLNIRRGQLGVATAKISYQQAWGAFLPTANTSGSYGESFGRSINPVTNSYINRNLNSINVGASGSLTLFNGFSKLNQFRKSRIDVDAADLDLKKAQNDITISVVTAFTNVLFNTELYQNASYVLASSQEQLDRTKKMVEAGSLPMADALNQEATVASNELSLINQENTLNLSKLQLKQIMQLPAATPIEIEVPEIALEDLMLTKSAESIYEVAKNTMPEIQSASSKVESARLGLQATRGRYYPSLSFNANISSNYSSASNVPRSIPSGDVRLSEAPFGADANGSPVYAYQPLYKEIASEYNQKDQLKDNLFKSFSVSLSIPLFNGFQTRGSVQRAVIAKEQAMITKTETENTLRQTIETAYNDAMAASRSYMASLKQVSAREEAYRMNQQRYELGALSAVELQISANDFNQAKTDLTRAKYNFIFRKKALDFYQGIEFTF